MFLDGHVFCPIGEHACPPCPRSASPHYILRHVARVHGPIYYPWVCGLCPLEQLHYYTDASGMMNHWRSHHPNCVIIDQVLHPKLGMNWAKFPITFLHEIKNN